MMKYTIKRKRLPQARMDQVYTLTIYMGCLGQEGSNTREAKVQYPVINHREGICKYRELRRMQRLLDAQDLVSVPSTPKALPSNVVVRPAHGQRITSIVIQALRTTKPADSHCGIEDLAMLWGAKASHSTALT